MPGIFYEPISRKRFLQTAATAAGAILLAPGESESRAGDESSGALRVALLSDTHIPADPANEYRGFRPVENLTQVVGQVVAADPGLTIIDGDAARLDGQADDYRSLRQLLAPVAARAPVCVGLGNHDDRANFFRIFPVNERQETAVKGKHVAVIEKAGLRFIVLDSLMYVNKVAGLLGKSQRTWLDQFLRQCDPLPTMLFVHHTLGDGDGDLLDVDRMFRIVEPHAHVKAIFYGHSHRFAVDRHENIQLINLPAVGYNFVDSEPVGWVEGNFTRTGVDLKLWAIGGNTEGHDQTTSVTWA
jgi:3',5'-cyclic AMP phosphodiesterase CpdA